MFGFIFLLFSVFQISSCNWSQLGHDSENLYESKLKDSWSVTLPGYVDFGVNFLVDDSTGMIWYFFQWYPNPQVGYVLYKVMGVDGETGKSKFITKINCTDGMIPPVLTSEGMLVFFADVDSSFKTMLPDGTLGTWKFDLDPKERVIQTAITPDDILILATTKGFTDKFRIRGVKVGHEKVHFKSKFNPPTVPLWIVNTTDMASIGEITISGDFCYFTEQFSLDDPVHFWVLRTKTGDIETKRPIFSRQAPVNTRIAISESLSMAFFSNPWAVDTEPYVPMIIGMDILAKKSIWKYAVPKSIDVQSCSHPIVVGENIGSICSTTGIISAKYYLLWLDGKTGKELGLNLVFSPSHQPKFYMEYNYNSGVYSKENGTILMNKRDNEKGSTINILHGETGKMEKLLGGVCGGDNIIYDRLVTDATGCIYFCCGLSDYQPQVCSKRCIY